MLTGLLNHQLASVPHLTIFFCNVNLNMYIIHEHNETANRQVMMLKLSYDCVEWSHEGIIKLMWQNQTISLVASNVPRVASVQLAAEALHFYWELVQSLQLVVNARRKPQLDSIQRYLLIPSYAIERAFFSRIRHFMMDLTDQFRWHKQQVALIRHLPLR